MTLSFQVFGVAQPKGSAKAFVIRGTNRAVVTNDNPKGKSWQQLVAHGAHDALAALPTDARQMFVGGVRLTVDFYLPRPKKFSKRGGEVTHTTRPDLDKVVRAVGDALTKVVWHDDAQIVELLAAKRYARLSELPHVDIRIEPCRGSLMPHEEHSLFEEGGS